MFGVTIDQRPRTKLLSNLVNKVNKHIKESYNIHIANIYIAMGSRKIFGNGAIPKKSPHKDKRAFHIGEKGTPLGDKKPP